MKYIIAGTGPAGVIAAETLRKVDPGAGILLIGDEPEPPYSRMAIPYLLSGGIDEAGTYLRKAKDHYQGLDIQVRQDRITAVSAEKHEVTLDGGKTESFDRLLISTADPGGPDSGTGSSTTTSFAGLSSRRPRKLAWRTTWSAVNSLNAISATSSGFSQCAPRASARGTSAAGFSASIPTKRLRRSWSATLPNPVPTLPA